MLSNITTYHHLHNISNIMTVLQQQIFLAVISKTEYQRSIQLGKYIFGKLILTLRFYNILLPLFPLDSSCLLSILPSQTLKPTYFIQIRSSVPNKNIFITISVSLVLILVRIVAKPSTALHALVDISSRKKNAFLVSQVVLDVSHKKIAIPVIVVKIG